MEGIGLDNMLGAEEVSRLFSSPLETVEETAVTEEEATASEENNDTEEAAEVDFSDLLGHSQPESVGSGKKPEGNRETPESSDDSGTPQANLFSSIARILRDKGVFPDLSDDRVSAITDENALEQLFSDKVTSMLDERQRRIEKAINGGASPAEIQDYQQALNLSNYLESRDTYSTLTQEGDAGEQLRKQVMYQDYINRGFSHEKAVKMVQRSLDDGTDMDDAKEAYESCRKFYKDRVDAYQQELSDRQQQQKAVEEKQYASLKKHLLDKDSFYDGVKVDKTIRQKAYDSITKPVYKDEQGNYLTALQKYQRENPMEFMENVALLYAITGEFKSVEKLAKDKAKAKVKSSYDEIANLLNNSRRNGDGTLNLANGVPDTSGRENWELAI